MKVDNNIKIGDYIELLDDVKMFNTTYTKGHLFKVFSCGDRGWDLIDMDGNKILETGLINHLLKKYK